MTTLAPPALATEPVTRDDAALPEERSDQWYLSPPLPDPGAPRGARRRRPRTFQPRACEVCGESFVPSGPRSLRCDTCMGGEAIVEEHTTALIYAPTARGWAETVRPVVVLRRRTRQIGDHGYRLALVIVEGESEPRWIADERIGASPDA